MALLSDALNPILGKPLAAGLNANPFTFESKGGKRKNTRSKSKSKRRKTKSRKTCGCWKLW
jgi:hypothetical protein